MIKAKPLCPFSSGTKHTRDTRARLSPLRGGNLLPRVPSCLSTRPLFPSHCSWSILDTQSPAIEKITAAEILVFADYSSFFTFEQLHAHNVQPAVFASVSRCLLAVRHRRPRTDRERQRPPLFFFFHDFVVRCSTFQTRTMATYEQGFCSKVLWYRRIFFAF